MCNFFDAAVESNIQIDDPENLVIQISVSVQFGWLLTLSASRQEGLLIWSYEIGPAASLAKVNPDIPGDSSVCC
jgi:hypothetical protein